MMPQMQLIKLVDKMTKCIDSDKCDSNQMQSDIREFAKFVSTLQPSVAQCVLPILVSPFLALHSKKDEFQKCSEEKKILLLNVLHDILSRTKMNNETGFNLLFDFLLVQIVDTKTAGAVLVTSEEHKLAVLTCFETLFTSMSWDLFPVIYTEKHIPKFCLLLHSCLEILKKEKNRSLQLSALECIMKAAKVDDSADFEDVVLLSQIAGIFQKFLPGIAACLIVIAVDDTKCGYKIVSRCVKAWARLVSILLRSYDPAEHLPKLEDLFIDSGGINEKYNNNNSVHDEKLAMCGNLLMKLTAYDHTSVRKQLAKSCQLLTSTCFNTLPATITKMVEILMVLSSDSDNNVCEIANATLVDVNNHLIEDTIRSRVLVDNLQHCFHQHLTQLPRVFNGLNCGEQVTSLNLLAGYLKLFSESSKLKNVLFEETCLSRLIGCLLHAALIDKTTVSLLEEYKLHDWEATADCRAPWKNFQFNDTRIQEQLERTCHLLARPVIMDIVLDYLLEVFNNDRDRRAEATLIMNEISSVRFDEKLKEIIDMYLLDENWKLPLAVMEGVTSLKNVHNNLLQLCLQLEGLGKIALAMGKRFERFMLKVLYPVLEKAGSSHPLLQAAGLACIANISKACGYDSVTELVNNNADYFAYNVTNKLRRRTENVSVLSVLAVVMHYSTMDVLPSISDIVEGVLLQSCDKFQEQNAAAYLRVFAVFVKSMHIWLKVQIVFEPVVTKREQEEKQEALQRLQWEEMNKPVDLSDEVMGTTDDELSEEEEQLSEYQKPKPPKHIQLVVNILERSVNFLPSKDTNCKLFVLEILKSGVELLKEYEDELLPIVHKIWSPLVNRFRDIGTPLVVNLSFDLLLTLGRLSKDFIRMRTVKEVLPAINDVLVKQAKESYLKDRGSAYRYTQGYKMQLNILAGIGRLAYDLELDDKINIVFPGVEVYLSSKQPLPLQEAAVLFYQELAHYDPVNGHIVIEALGEMYRHRADWNRNLNILLSVTQ